MPETSEPTQNSIISEVGDFRKTLAALETAYRRRSPAGGLTFHSDHRSAIDDRRAALFYGTIDNPRSGVV